MAQLKVQQHHFPDITERVLKVAFNTKTQTTIFNLKTSIQSYDKYSFLNSSFILLFYSLLFINLFHFLFSFYFFIIFFYYYFFFALVNVKFTFAIAYPGLSGPHPYLRSFSFSATAIFDPTGNNVCLYDNTYILYM